MGQFKRQPTTTHLAQKRGQFIIELDLSLHSLQQRIRHMLTISLSFLRLSLAISHPLETPELQAQADALPAAKAEKQKAVRLSVVSPPPA